MASFQCFLHHVAPELHLGTTSSIVLSPRAGGQRSPRPRGDGNAARSDINQRRSGGSARRDTDKQNVSPPEKDWTHCGMIVKALVHPSPPRRDTVYPGFPRRRDRGLKRPTGAELRPVSDRVAARSDLLKVIGVSG